MSDDRQICYDAFRLKIAVNFAQSACSRICMTAYFVGRVFHQRAFPFPLKRHVYNDNILL